MIQPPHLKNQWRCSLSSISQLLLNLSRPHTAHTFHWKEPHKPPIIPAITHKANISNITIFLYEYRPFYPNTIQKLSYSAPFPDSEFSPTASSTRKFSSSSTADTYPVFFVSYWDSPISKANFFAFPKAIPTGQSLEVIHHFLADPHWHRFFSFCFSSWFLLVSAFVSFILTRIF